MAAEQRRPALHDCCCAGCAAASPLLPSARHIFFCCMTTARSGLPVMGSLYLAHTSYTLRMRGWQTAGAGAVGRLVLRRVARCTPQRPPFPVQPTQAAHLFASDSTAGTLVMAYTHPRPTSSYRRLHENGEHVFSLHEREAGLRTGGCRPSCLT